MTDHGEGSSDHSDYRPNFAFPHHGVIREDNWPEYQAKGFEPVIEDLDGAQLYYGIGHVYTGDAYDYEEERPLRHKPGVGIYVDPEGLAYNRKWMAEHKRWLRDHAF